LNIIKCTISDISEIVVEKMKNKNPNVKAESIKWLIRCMKTGKNIPQKDQIKILSEGLLKVIYIYDSFENAYFSY